MATQPIPEGYHTVSAYLAVEDAARAIEFYKQAFGAVLTARRDARPGVAFRAWNRIASATCRSASSTSPTASRRHRPAAAGAAGRSRCRQR